MFTVTADGISQGYSRAPCFTKILLLVLGAILFIELSGCATMPPTSIADVRALHYGMKPPELNATLKQPVMTPRAPLKFTLESHNYEIGTFSTRGVQRLYEVVFKDGHLVAVVDRGDLQKPLFGRCLTFPTAPTLDISKCLSAAATDAEHDRVDFTTLKPGKSDPIVAQAQNESTGDVAMTGTMIALAPEIMVPVYALSIPFLMYESGSEHKLLRKAQDIKLGDSLESAKRLLGNPPTNMQSTVGSYQVDLFPFGRPRIPGLTVGAVNGKIIWIEFSPPAACGGAPYACKTYNVTPPY